MKSTTRFFWTLALAFVLGIFTSALEAPMWVNFVGVVIIVIIMSLISNRMNQREQ
ncbi:MULTISPECIES: hypothetical protein [Pontibacillus]|uniref:Uncharacterized protein n=1 Tax=Pontibacillus chungwhensis TaxID=265426 RepID=A0ABY8V1X8_9BACI|nr:MULTISPECIES: hypothetical protein [Pontibacillus]MCD5322359.1 hypothetical protein [Pontibacillus sp. HN14]WIF99648.1 hypothetical protein QNI29_08320 [Pontibacillus chungwhensis]